MSSKTESEGKVDLKFKKDLFPYKSNMRQFEKDYNFTFEDGTTTTPKFCLYNGKPHVYLNDAIISFMCKTAKDKQLLIDYIKKNFKEGHDKSDE